MLILLAIAMANPVTTTDFGVRSVSTQEYRQATFPVSAAPVRKPAANLALAAQIGSRFGRVTSTWRSPERNRLVGGVVNSWHLSGRAIDIVRSPTVSHASLATSLRAAGFFLIESLDEGDHSHFAFGSPGIHQPRSPRGGVSEVQQEASYFTFRRAPLASR